MERVNKAFSMIGDLLSHVMNLGVQLIAVGVVLQILFGSSVPFVGIDVVESITKFVGALGEKGLVGLVALAIIFWAWNKK